MNIATLRIVNYDILSNVNRPTFLFVSFVKIFVLFVLRHFTAYRKVHKDGTKNTRFMALHGTDNQK